MAAAGPRALRSGARRRTPASARAGRGWGGALAVLTAAALLAVLAPQAWIDEDAHITLRTVDNFVNGNGLTWNVGERVQTYTHPLWMLVMSGAYFFTREIYTTLAGLCLVFSLGAYGVLARHFRSDPPALLLALFAPWVLSYSLVRYSTSGFENPLSFFLLALFAVELLRRAPGGVPWGRLALLAALAGVNRLDTLLLYAPALALLMAVERRSIAWRRLLAGLSPLAAWILFSLFYYGFPFPNTAYAKLPSALPRSAYLEKGLLYLADLFRTDPAGSTMLVLGAAITAVCGWRLLRAGDNRAGRAAALGAGMLLYAAYVVWVGGDYQSGRFWSLPVLAAMVICASEARAVLAGLRSRTPAARAALAGALAGVVVGAHAGASALDGGLFIRPRPIASVRLNGALDWQRTDVADRFRRAGLAARHRAEREGRWTQRLGTVGIAGIAAGREVEIIDDFAIVDPLRARLAPESFVIPGHLPRHVPEGYLKARETGSLDAMDPALARYYAKLRLIVSAPLLSRERITAIVLFNLGAYDHLLREYEAQGGDSCP